MAKAKIKIKKPGRLIFAVLLVAVIIAAIIILPSYLGGDKIQKEIEAIEGQKVTVLSKEIKLYQGEAELNYTDSTTPIILKPGQYITFKVVYQYKNDTTGKINSYRVESGISIKVSNTSLATIVNDNSLQIPNTITTESTFNATVSFKGVDNKTYSFKISPDVVTPPDDGDTGGEDGDAE